VIAVIESLDRDSVEALHCALLITGPNQLITAARLLGRYRRGSRIPPSAVSSDTRRLSECAPNVNMRLLPDTGHYLPGQAGTVLDFLTESARQNAQ
jgi:hypothetical protein